MIAELTADGEAFFRGVARGEVMWWAVSMAGVEGVHTSTRSGCGRQRQRDLGDGMNVAPLGKHRRRWLAARLQGLTSMSRRGDASFV
jgi:hypothetical protein